MPKRDFNLMLSYWINESLYNLDKALEYVIKRETKGVYKKIDEFVSKYLGDSFKNDLLKIVLDENEKIKFIKDLKIDVRFTYSSIHLELSKLNNTFNNDQAKVELLKSYGIMDEFEVVVPENVLDILYLLYDDVELDEIFGLPF